MRCLVLSSLIVLLVGCTPVYKNLPAATGDIHGVDKFRPAYDVALYNTAVNVTTHHLSGLLLVKTMPDSSVRMVFSSEMGLKFFDFEFLHDGSFKVNYIIKQMNKKAVIKTLRKDFDLVLMRRRNFSTAYLRKDGGLLYYVFPQKKGSFCYITNAAGDSLQRMEIASKKKPIVVATMQQYHNGIPDTIGITHKNFKFTIELKKIER